MNKHTPGPWQHLGKGYVRTILPSGYSQAIAHAYSVSHGSPTVEPDLSDAEALANADLIAQAPELLDWKESAMPLLTDWHEVGDVLGGATVGDLGGSVAKIALREAKRLKASHAELLDLAIRVLAYCVDGTLKGPQADDLVKHAREAVANVKGTP